MVTSWSGSDDPSGQDLPDATSGADLAARRGTAPHVTDHELTTDVYADPETVRDFLAGASDLPGEITVVERAGGGSTLVLRLHPDGSDPDAADGLAATLDDLKRAIEGSSGEPA
jgi:hypothetical protein